MTFDDRLLCMFEEEITYEPPTTRTQSQAQSYGTAVTYPAQVLPWVERVITAVSGHAVGENAGSREVLSKCKVIIPGRVELDPQGRITLPAGHTPQQPQIRAVRPYKGIGLDCTEILC
jgi:hypothetical protein